MLRKHAFVIRQLGDSIFVLDESTHRPSSDATVKFSSGIEEIYDDNKSDDIDYKLFYNISNKKFMTV